MFTNAKIGKSKPFHKHWDDCKLLKFVMNN